MSALDQGVNGYSGKPSVKDKISCKIRFHAGKTAQKVICIVIIYGPASSIVSTNSEI